MTYHIPNDVQDRMLFAVDNFDEAHKTTPDGTPRDRANDTEEFWKALANWAPYALVGSFDMELDTSTGEVTVKFRPAK